MIEARSKKKTKDNKENQEFHTKDRCLRTMTSKKQMR
jgi:hypothetical protein